MSVPKTMEEVIAKYKDAFTRVVTKTDLIVEIKSCGVKGYSKMNKNEVIDTLEQHKHNNEEHSVFDTMVYSWYLKHKQALDALNKDATTESKHEGANCPLTVRQEYCTIKHKSYNELLEFLKGKKVNTLEDYKTVQKECDWLPMLGYIKKTYPMFAFQDLDEDSHKYYATKEECIKAYEECKYVIEARYGEMITELTEKECFSECLLLDDRLPPIDIDLYYY